VQIQGALWLQYASQGGLVDLTPYLERDKEYADRLYPEILAGWTLDGKNYGVPYFLNKSMLYLNRIMMEDAGITEDPQSFEDIVAYAEEMSAGEKTGLITLNFDWLYWPLFAMNGIDFVSEDMTEAAFNTPETVALVEKLADLTDRGVINKISWTGRWVEPNGAFAAGTVGMLHGHSGSFLWIKSKADWVDNESVGAMNMPGGWSTPNMHGLVTSAGTEHPEEAWDFIKTATSGKGAEIVGKGNNILTGDRAVNEELVAYFEKEIPALAAVLKTQFEDLDKLTGNWAFAEDAAIKEAFFSELQAALLGEKDAQAALDAAEKKVNRLLSRSRR